MGLTPESAVLSYLPHPGAWPTGTAEFGSVNVSACGKRPGTQGKCGLINKLKLFTIAMFLRNKNFSTCATRI